MENRSTRYLVENKIVVRESCVCVNNELPGANIVGRGDGTTRAWDMSGDGLQNVYRY